MHFGAALLIAALAAALMGYAIQRGATCTVAAVDELVHHRSARRLLAMAEASLWVAGGLALASALDALPAMPTAYPVDVWVFVGGALLGLGAWVNRACVFGAIARLGSGEWSYAATPLGYFAGCLSVGRLFAAPTAAPLGDGSVLLRSGTTAAMLFVAFAAWRVMPALRAALGSDLRRSVRELGRRVWAPHAATAVIGVTFVVVLLAVGSVWAYTDVLAQLAHGMTMRTAVGVLLLLALIAGAIAGGWTAGRLRPTPPSAAAIARCFTGGLLMAWGSLLIPGSNDGLILVGMPLARPYAWLAFATMAATIALALVVGKWVARGPAIQDLR